MRTYPLVQASSHNSSSGPPQLELDLGFSAEGQCDIFASGLPRSPFLGILCIPVAPDTLNTPGNNIVWLLSWFLSLTWRIFSATWYRFVVAIMQ